LPALTPALPPAADPVTPDASADPDGSSPTHRLSVLTAAWAFAPSLTDPEAAAALDTTSSPALLALATGFLALATFGALASTCLTVYSPTKLQNRQPGPAGEALVRELERREREYRVVARFFLVGGLVGALLSVQTGVRSGTEALALGGMVVVALLLCGSIPQGIAAVKAETTLLRVLPILRGGLMVLRWPLVLPILAVTTGVMKALRIREEPSTDPEEIAEEVMAAVSDSVDEDALADEEKAWIGNIVGLKDLQVSTIMTPRPDMVAIAADMPLREAVRTALEHGFSRYPVYRERADEITGLFFVKDALRHMNGGSGADEPVQKIVRPPLFVPESMPVPQLLRRMQAEKIHLAIVLDEYGTTAGLVSVEDVLEEIVGDIHDEYDADGADSHKVVIVDQGRAAEIPGRFPVGEANERFGLSIPEDGDWETVAGYVIHHANHIPAAGETIAIDGTEFVVVAGDDRKIERLRVPLRDAEPAPQQA
jgi:putative hemolysin